MKALRDWNTSEATNYLKLNNISSEKVLSVSIAGEGNMNCTLRLKCESESFIIKQSSEYCEKYPTVSAPIGRICEEERFYRFASENRALQNRLPKILFFNPSDHILVMEDLGNSNDFSFVYNKGKTIKDEDLQTLGGILSDIHKTELGNESFSNRNMRILNHEHIFDIPLRRNNNLELDKITSGLQNEANSLIESITYKKRVSELGGLYLYEGKTLLHGDYYPNSWLQTQKGIYIIDPEFGFIGLSEIDLGVTCGHLYLSQHSEEQIDTFLSNYQLEFDRALVNQFAGVEIMRRLIGVAQLPVNYGINQKINLLIKSKELVLN